MKYFKCVWAVLLIFCCMSAGVFADGYAPEISGDYKWGQKLYEEIKLNDETGEKLRNVDKVFRFRNMWLRYKQQLTAHNYYYIRGEFYQKDFVEDSKDDYNSFEFSGNYTFMGNDKIRNKIDIVVRKNDYLEKLNNCYNKLDLGYELRYDYNHKHRYTISFDKNWQEFPERESKNKTIDKIKVIWRNKINDKLNIESSIQYNQEIFLPQSTSTNKYQTTYGISFKIKL